MAGRAAMSFEEPLDIFKAGNYAFLTRRASARFGRLYADAEFL